MNCNKVLIKKGKKLDKGAKTIQVLQKELKLAK